MPFANELHERRSDPAPSLFRPRALWIMVAFGLAGALETAIFAGGTQQLPVPVVPPSRGLGISFAKVARGEEPNVLAALQQSLAVRRNELETESLELEKQRKRLEALTAAYQGQVVPPGAQQTYQQMLADYNNRVLEHNKNLARWQSDDAQYRSRRTALHAQEEEVAKR